MSNKQSSFVCLAGGWGFAAIIAVLAAIILMLIAGWSFLASIFAAVIIFIIAGCLLSWNVCNASHDENQAAVASAPTTQDDTAPAANIPSADPVPVAAPPTENSEPVAASERVAEDQGAPASTKPVIKPSTALAGTAELAERKGTWRYEGGDKPSSSAPAADAPDSTEQAVDAAPVVASEAAPDSDDGGSAARAPVAADGKPEQLNEAREGGPDDLKMIKGVGPKLETLLHKMGFFHFDQVAGWRAKEIAWVDENLEGFKGRVTRDEWVKQAKVLAKGGATEFSKKAGKGGVY
ncbi:MAG: endonuclease [Aliishimia sp.]